MNDYAVNFALLVDYVEGRLGPDAAEAVRRDLSAGGAEVDVRVLREILDELRALGPEPSPALIQRVIRLFPGESSFVETLRQLPRIVGELVFDSRVQPALAGFRGMSDGYQVAYESDDVRVDLLIGPSSSEPGSTWRVRGQLDVRNGGSAGPVVLSRTDADGTVVMSTSIDDCGRFRIDSEPGTYELTVDLESATFVAPGIELG